MILLAAALPESDHSLWVSKRLLCVRVSHPFPETKVCCQFEHDAGPGKDAPNVFKKVKDEICPRLHDLEVMLSSMIDFPESANRKRLSIQEGICDDLDELKRQFEGLSNFLHTVAVEEEEDLLHDAASVEFYVIFVPQLGYMVSCPNDDSRRVLEAVPGYKLNFATNEMAYFKTPRMEELDYNVGDIFGEIFALVGLNKKHGMHSVVTKALFLHPCSRYL